MYGQITPITEYDRIAVLSLRVIADGARRVFRGHREVRLGYVLGLQDEDNRSFSSSNHRKGKRVASSRSAQESRHKTDTHKVKPLLLQPVHDNLKRLVRHGVLLVLLPVVVHGGEPFLVCGEGGR